MRRPAPTQPSDVLFPMLRRENLASRVAAILERLIVAEQLQPGDRLPAERRLAEQLTVSRTVLREALSLLIGKGIIYRSSPHALMVAEFDRSAAASRIVPLDHQDAETQDMIELRAVLEVGAIESIVERATDADLRAIERWVIEGERRAEAGGPIHFADARFHEALLSVLQNRAIDSLLPIIRENLRQSTLTFSPPMTAQGEPRNMEDAHQHRAIFEAIRRSDVAEARRLMLVHLAPYLRRA